MSRLSSSSLLLLLPLLAAGSDLASLLESPPESSLLTQIWLEDRSDRVPRQAEGSGDLPDEVRRDRQSGTGDGDSPEGSVDCEFGSADVGELCDYANPVNASLRWTASTGSSGNWLGGPLEDAEGLGDGGYAFFETSAMPDISSGVNTESAMLESARLAPTGPGGQCIQFRYAMQGMSVDRLRLLLHPVGEEEKQGGAADHREDHVVWISTEPDEGWQQAQHLYSFNREHTMVFEAIPLKGEERQYRGYIAIDTVRAVDGDRCPGHCTFDGGICTWRQGDNDDFQWSLGRGSTSTRTGPIRDRSSERFGGTAGGYAFVDSDHPRRPGDTARLLSPELPATSQDGPLCFRFWTHMFGSGVGRLRVLRLTGGSESELWSLAGESGQQWHQAQVPVSSSDRFTIAVEGEIGQSGQGDIAIDDLSLRPGVCPGVPQSAAVGAVGCTFEDDFCGWTNPGSSDRVDQVDWERVPARTAQLPHVDHTYRSERNYLARLKYTEPQRSGDTGWLVSPQLEGSADTKCLTFWYFMDSLIATSAGPRLGGLKVWARYDDDEGKMQTDLLWKLNNAQSSRWMPGQLPVSIDNDYKIIFEGMWGGSTKGAIALDDVALIDGDCEQRPGHTLVSAGDCDFSSGSCGWRNSTDDEDSQQRWRAATRLSRPTRLSDHTFRTSTGYVYFDVFSPQGSRLRLRLRSPVIDMTAGRGSRGCVGFWYATLSPTESARLRVLYEPAADEDNEAESDRGDAGTEETVLWSLRASDTDAGRLTWLYAEVDFNADQRFRLTFEGSASNLGFALDDISFRSGSCRVRPTMADPSRRNADEDQQSQES